MKYWLRRARGLRNARGPWVCALLALGGCELTRPDEAYTPGTYSADDYGFGNKPDAGEPDAPDQPDDPDVSPDEPDAAMDTPVVVDPSNPASALQGRYLMRVDVYSTASASQAGSTLTLNNRVSNLLVSDVSVRADGTLFGRETLCYQTYYNECVSNCRDWATEVDPEVPKKFSSRVIERDYAVDERGRLTVGASTLPLGFDESDGVSALPNASSDARVWSLGTPDKPRYGIVTHLTASIGPSIAATKLDCIVSTVQRFATAFAGQLDLSKGKDALVQKPMAVDTTGTAGATVYVNGTPTQYCNKATLDTAGDQPSDATTVVRFRRFDDGVGCPSSATEYARRFPDVNTRPKAADLM